MLSSKNQAVCFFRDTFTFYREIVRCSRRVNVAIARTARLKSNLVPWTMMKKNYRDYCMWVDTVLFFFFFHFITIVATSRGVDVLFVPALLVLYWIIVVETTEQICRVHIISLHWNLLNIKFCYKGISESIHAWVGNFKLLQVPDITCGKKHNYALLGFLYIQCLDRPIHLVLLMKRPCFINRTLNSKI